MSNFDDFENLHSENEINSADDKLKELATYEITQGKISSLTSINQYVEFQKKVLEKFNYFKYLIKNREATIDELASIVKNRYGPYPQKFVDDTNIEALLLDLDNKAFVEKKIIKPVNPIDDAIADSIIKFLFPKKLPKENIESIESAENTQLSILPKSSVPKPKKVKKQSIKKNAEKNTKRKKSPRNP